MENFTPYSSLAGGALIGLAATLLWMMNGRVAGISGIVNGFFARVVGDTAWRAWFLAGLLAGGAIYSASAGIAFELRSGFPMPLLILAGLLVGIGTRLGSGCTSGHGVCGIARLSTRSLVATAVFLITGMLTVFLITQHFVEL